MWFSRFIAIAFLLQVTSFGTGLSQRSPNSTQSVQFSRQDLTILVDEIEYFDVLILPTAQIQVDSFINLEPQHADIVDVDPKVIKLKPGDRNQTHRISVLGVNRGHLEINGKASPAENFDVSNLFIRIVVAYSHTLIKISNIVGWAYFVAWSASFYPQIVSNFQRKSVVGLSFDFTSLNLVGFTLYSIFNAGLYWNSYIKEEYMNRYPRGQNPVRLNDIFFSFHAGFATLITVYQCVIYERGQQRVSHTARTILGIFGLCVAIFALLAFSNKIHWLDFLNYCSYIKLLITLMKYVPQAIMNFKRKSTDGWSIGNVLLDFTGGSLSMMQMIFDGYNYDDFESIFGDPTKFGLGLFSVTFDTLFIVQHYVLYRNAVPYNEFAGEVVEENREE